MSQRTLDVSGFTTYLGGYNSLPGPDFTANVQQSALYDGGRGRLDFASSFFLRVPLTGWVVQGWGSDFSFLSLSVTLPNGCPSSNILPARNRPAIRFHRAQ